jgi:hypothetical protein
MKNTFEPDEKQLSRHEVTLVEDRKGLLATLVLTDRRVAILYSETPAGAGWWFGMIGALFSRLLDEDRPRIRHQIRRDRFASVEEGDGKLLVFHDVGEGYGHTSFAITSKDSFVDWQQRMHRWAAGLDASPTLPSARIIDR